MTSCRMGPKLCRVVEYGEVKLQVEEGGGRVGVREGERNGWEWKKEIKKKEQRREGIRERVMSKRRGREEKE